jgi:hypothetical protein
MYLVQILLPLTAPADRRRLHQFDKIKQELTAKFGGMTFYRSAPAEGLWQESDDVEKDLVVTAEIMAAELEQDWWAQYRKRLEQDLAQKEIVVRSFKIERL